MNTRIQLAARHMILELLNARQSGKTICPSEVARALDAGNFRPLMPHVRDAAQQLAQEGRIEVAQRGAVVDIGTARGPMRLRLRNRSTRRS